MSLLKCECDLCSAVKLCDHIVPNFGGKINHFLTTTEAQSCETSATSSQ